MQYSLNNYVDIQGQIQEEAIGAIAPPLKPTKVSFFTKILYNSEKNIPEIRPFCRPFFCHSSVVKYTSSLTAPKALYETCLSNFTEISPLTLLPGSAPLGVQPNPTSSWSEKS